MTAFGKHVSKMQRTVVSKINPTSFNFVIVYNEQVEEGASSRDSQG